MITVDKIVKLTKQLYPTGRAFKMPYDGVLESLHKALSISEAQAFNDAIAIRDSLLPDNANFTTADATDWERRLGLITNNAVSLADRKLAIARKINHPGIVAARQNYRYLQLQLQAAGFNLYVYENRFASGPGYVTQNPVAVTGGAGLVSIQHGDAQHGDVQSGGGFGDIVVNSIDPQRDYFFDVGSNLRSTFFIGGNTLGAFANVDADRRTELRQLILKIKPVQTVAYLLITYI